MHTLTDKSAASGYLRHDTVEIKLWEIYLLYNRRNLYRTLSTYSLDNGPVEKDHQEEGRVTFRFMAFDWERTIKELLYENRIPVIVQSGNFAAVRARGGHGVATNF